MFHGWIRKLRRQAALGLLPAALLCGGQAVPAQEPRSITITPSATISFEQAPPAASQPAAPAAPAPAAPGCVSGCCPFDWTKVPALSKTPRAGNFGVFPTGCGYYSVFDAIRGELRDTPPVRPYPPVGPCFDSFFNNDFRYLDKPDNQQHDFLDPLKRIHLGDDFLLSFGGEERLRYMNEVNSRLTGKFNDYLLERSRVYGDFWYRDVVRVYVEFVNADSIGQNLTPLAIDVNKADLQNAFVDLKVTELNDAPIYVRAGRQELLYGSERLISPLDWANTRRTFQGVKAFWHSENFDVDAFWVEPVVPAEPNRFDNPDHHRQFAGLWTTYRPEKTQAIDLYYLYLDNNKPAVAKPPAGGRGGYDVNTIGSRYHGDHCNFLWDVEAMYQWGEFTNKNTSAASVTTGVGYHFKDAPMSPVVWLYNDWASGDHSGGTRDIDTFNQLFPFGHYYFGFLDLVGRQNIEDINAHLYLYPTHYLTLNAQFHELYLDSARDALYGPASQKFRVSPLGLAGYHVGEELDFTTNVHIDQHSDLLIGYSVMFQGEFLRNTSPNAAARANDPSLWYVQYSFKW